MRAPKASDQGGRTSHRAAAPSTEQDQSPNTADWAPPQEGLSTAQPIRPRGQPADVTGFPLGRTCPVKRPGVGRVWGWVRQPVPRSLAV